MKKIISLLLILVSFNAFSQDAYKFQRKKADGINTQWITPQVGWGMVFTPSLSMWSADSVNFKNWLNTQWIKRGFNTGAPNISGINDITANGGSFSSVITPILQTTNYSRQRDIFCIEAINERIAPTAINSGTINPQGANTFSITNTGTINFVGSPSVKQPTYSALGGAQRKFICRDGVVWTNSTKLVLPSTFTTQAGDIVNLILTDTTGQGINKPQWTFDGGWHADGTPIFTPTAISGNGISIATSLSTYTVTNTAPLYSVTATGTGAATLTNGVLNIPTPTKVNAANKIFVDSRFGNNATGIINDENNKFQTVEYVLANTNNTGTVTATTTNSSNTLTAVSSTANIEVGQIIYGTNIPLETYVVSFTSNSIVLSKPCTAAATITATWVTQYLIVGSGSFTAASNWRKDGFHYSMGNSMITFGNLTLFNSNSSVPQYVEGGFWFGTHPNSKLLTNSAFSFMSWYFDIKYYSSVGTGAQCDLALVYGFQNFIMNCPNFLCNNGSIAGISETFTNSKFIFSGYKYGLLGGISVSLNRGFMEINGVTETPQTVTALNLHGHFQVNGNTYGSVVLTPNRYSKAVINGSIGVFPVNTSLTINNNGGSISFNNEVLANITITGTGTADATNCILFNGNVIGGVTNFSSCVVKLNCYTPYYNSYTGSNNSYAVITPSQNNYVIGASGSRINLTGTSKVDLLNSLNVTTPSRFTTPIITVGSGCTLNVLGTCLARFELMAGTLNLSSTSELSMVLADGGAISYNITGIINNNNGKINLIRPTDVAESATQTPTLRLNGGTYIQTGGSLTCPHADSKSGLIQMIGTGSKVILRSQPQLKVANGLAPIQVLSNTSKEIFDYSVIDNCAAGFRLGDTFSDATYGTPYAPTLMVGGDLFESTTNNW
jgi:hypothetical protein